MKSVALAIATAGGLGRAPIAPGTFGSGAGLVVWAVLPPSPIVHALAIGVPAAILSYLVLLNRQQVAGADEGAATDRSMRIEWYPIGRILAWSAVMAGGLTTAVAGVGLGLAIAVVAAPRIQGLLFRTSARDVVVLSTAAVLVLLVSAAAAWIPGRRAVRIDPVTALRAD